MKICLDPLQELNVSPVLCGSNTDDMALENIYNRMAYISTFTWGDTSPTMAAPLFISGVSPGISAYGIVGSYVHTQPSPMAFASQPFAFWRGEIVFRFDVVCSAFHRGKICVYYEPNLAQADIITPDIALNKQHMVIIDIQQTQTFEVCVMWASHRPWLKVMSPASNYYIAVDPTSFSTSYLNFNGFIGVVPFTKLQSPDSSDVEINVFTCAKRLAVNGLTSANLPYERRDPSLSLGFMTESSCKVPLEIDCMELNPSAASMEHINMDYFGEAPLSFRALLKRYVYSEDIATPVSASGSTRYIDVEGPIMPINGLLYGATSASNTNLFTYMYYAYLGYRGGIRHVFNHTLTSALGAQYLNLALPSPNTATMASAVVSSSAIMRLEGTITLAANTPIMEAELPFYTINSFLISFSDTRVIDATNDVMSDHWYRNYDLNLVPTTGTSLLASNVSDNVAAAEDFSFMRFQGAPRHTGSPVV